MEINMRMLPKYPDMMFHNVAESSFVRVVRALLLSICKILHLQHKYSELTASVHDEYRCQTAHADGDRVNDVAS